MKESVRSIGLANWGAARSATVPCSSLPCIRRRTGPDPIPLGAGFVRTKERYLGCKQRIRPAVNNRIGIEPNPERSYARTSSRFFAVRVEPVEGVDDLGDLMARVSAEAVGLARVAHESGLDFQQFEGRVYCSASDMGVRKSSSPVISKVGVYTFFTREITERFISSSV